MQKPRPGLVRRLEWLESGLFLKTRLRRSLLESAKPGPYLEKNFGGLGS